MGKAYKINLDALAFNDYIKNENTFRFWQPDFSVLDDYGSPVPDAKSGDIDFSKDTGIMLHWTLPRFLRTYDETTGRFPLVPNRWLLYRKAEGFKDKAWIIESDNLKKRKDYGFFSPTYLGNSEIYEKLKNAGREFRIIDENKIQNIIIGKANDASNWNETTETKDEKNAFLTAFLPSTPVFTAYFPQNENIFSFYDNVSDIDSVSSIDKANVDYYIVGWYSFKQDSDLFFGQHSTINWDRNNKIIAEDKYEEIKNNNLIVGKNLNDTFISLLAAKTNETADLRKLTAFLGDFKEVFLREDKDYLFFEKHFAEQFSYLDYQLQFTSETADVSDINALSKKIDDNKRKLYELQRDVWLDFCREKYLEIISEDINITNKNPADYGISNNKNLPQILSLSQEISADSAILSEKTALIPDIKTIKTKRFYKPLNPTVAITNVDTACDLEIKNEENPVEITFNKTELFPNLPPLVSSVLNKLISEKNTVKHTQPFEPLLMEWRCVYVPISYKDNWIFDGNDYNLSEQFDLKAYVENQIKNEDLLTLSGYSPLSAHFKKIFEDKLSKICDTNDKITFDINDIKFLMQELNGFNDGIYQRDIRPFKIPENETVIVDGKTVKLTDLLDFYGDNALDFKVHSENSPSVNFYGIRCGAFYFMDLYVYDKFGRMLNIMLSDDQTGFWQNNSFPVIYSFDNVQTSKGVSAVLPPRFLEYARIDTDFSIYGFVIHNYVNKSLALFSEKGEYVGEISVKNNKVALEFPIQNAVPVPEKLKQFIGFCQNKNADEFYNYVSEIDNILSAKQHKTDSLYSGKPLVIADMSSQIEFYRKPQSNISWDCESGNIPEYSTYEYPFKIGNPNVIDDGFIGYFSDNYYTFNFSGVVPNDKKLKIDNAINFSLICEPTSEFCINTGFLPVARVKIPENLYKNTLLKLDEYYKFSPILTFTDGEIVAFDIIKEDGKTVQWQTKNQTYTAETTIKTEYVPEIHEGYLHIKN